MNGCQARHRFAHLFKMSVLLCVGCSGEVDYPVASLGGTVTIGKQPLPNEAEGQITFMPVGSGQPASCQIIQGRYQCPQVPMGEVTAIFKITRLTGRQVVEEGAPGSSPFAECENLVPVEHRNGLAVEVIGDNPEQDFAL